MRSACPDRLLGQLLIVGLALLIAGCQRADPPQAAPVRPTMQIALDAAARPLGEALINGYESVRPDVIISARPAVRANVLDALQREQVTAALLLHPPSDHDLFITPIGRENLAVIVHPSVPVDTLYRRDLQVLFAGQVVAWEQDDTIPPVQVVTGYAGSSTRSALDDLVLAGPITSSAQLGMDDQHVIELVATTPGAVGVVPTSSLGAETVKTVAFEDVDPTLASANQYPLSTPVMFVALDEPAGETRAFLEWVLSAEGQQVVGRMMDGIRD